MRLQRLNFASHRNHGDAALRFTTLYSRQELEKGPCYSRRPGASWLSKGPLDSYQLSKFKSESELENEKVQAQRDDEFESDDVMMISIASDVS